MKAVQDSSDSSAVSRDEEELLLCERTSLRVDGDGSHEASGVVSYIDTVIGTGVIHAMRWWLKERGGKGFARRRGQRLEGNRFVSVLHWLKEVR